ncbi:hypothetical protein [Paraburkholderia pallida]|uniref:Outer membrane assembly lipoprotein YfiO n=1 Tax=Paraburkholderia pallida TaxID=2547399 RepID=A0A4P7D4V6_9BURK|nr:hypothetical protein [Paraburkholderia pallida]QBR01910.1 hypothetical protein E1956_32750 [Paraburkholderia pallida]
MRRTPLLRPLPAATLAASLLALLPAAPAWASGDMGCYPNATLRQPAYSCGGVPILSPGNDTRINAMLLMTESSKLAQVFPDPKTVPAADLPNRLIVPFLYDFSGWIDIGQKQPDSASDASDASDTTDANSAAGGNGQSSTYADGEGNICRSVASGDKAFNDALNAANALPADDAARLRAARATVAKACAPGGADAAWTKPTGLKSALGQQFATYLDGAQAFYRQDFFPATSAFAGASHSADPWLKEAALYMAGRAQLNAAQANAFSADSTTPERANVTKVSLDAAGTVFRAYLRVYPHGRYAASAAGLQRRIAWLDGNATQQAALYDKAFAHWSPGASNVPLSQLANELDSKLLLASNVDASQIQSPPVLATIDLMRMRAAGDFDSGERKPLMLAELQAQKPRFAGAPALHDYLLAAYHVYVDHKPAEALALLPQSPSTPLDYFALSQQTLRAFALEDSGQAGEARQLWRTLIPLAQYRLQREGLELALAINLEQAGLVSEAFAEDSPVRNAGIRAVLLQHTANADLLRAQAQNQATSGALRDIALYTLLYKEFTRAHYAEFIADLALIPPTPADALKPFALPRVANNDGYACPSAREIAATLQQSPSDPKALNCLAEFVRANPPALGLGEDTSVMLATSPTPASTAAGTAAPPAPATLGSAPSQFQGKAYQRMTSYQSVIAMTQAPADDRAYALYRAINCFAPAGYSECGGNDIAQGTRKRWFNALKSAYPRSKWAQSLKYYW